MNMTAQNKKGKTRLLLTVSLIVALTFLLAGCNAAKETIGVLDFNKIMTDSAKVKEFREKLNAKGKELTDKLEQEKEGLSPEEFQRRQETAYGEFLKTKQELETEIEQTVTKAVEEVAKEKKISVILYKDGVAHGGVDITDDVLKKL